MAREMKDSGVEWIGEIPGDWKIAPLKRFAKIQTGNTPSKTDEVLFYAEEGVPWIKPDNLGMGIPITCTAEYLTPKGCDVARLMPSNTVYVCCIGSLGKVGYSLVECCCNQQINALIFNDMMYWKFGYYLTFAQESRYWLYGNGNVLQIINSTNQGNIECVVPPVKEQIKISSFLNKKCTEIDNILAKTRASIEEYKKLKQAIITQAVTKGVRSKREMKDSGTEWVGKMPSDIKISRVGLHYEIILGKMLCTNQIDDTYTYEPYFCAADIHFEGIAENKRKKMWFSPSEKEQYLVKEGDLLVVEGGAGAGGCTVAPMQEIPTYIQNSIMIVRPGKSVDVRYLKYSIECLVKQGYIDVACNKATIPHFTKDKLANVPFLVFSLQEQKEIAKYLDKKCSDIDAIISFKKNYIMEIENYKKSLIYEYVTGKKEVPQTY